MSVVYGYIYILTNKINNKKYVGQTTQTFNERYCFKGIGAERMYKYHSYMKRKKYHIINICSVRLKNMN